MRTTSILLFVLMVTEHANSTSFDTESLCREAKKARELNWAMDYDPAVFRVIKVSDGTDTYSIEGTASLIDRRGYFITAAHVVSDSQHNLILASSNAPLSNQGYSIETISIGTPGHSIQTVGEDWAIVKAVGWLEKENENIPTLPVRYTSDKQEASGTFLGFVAGGDGKLIRRTFDSQSVDSSYATVVEGMSGSLMIDSGGWGFGLVAAHGAGDTGVFTEDDRRKWQDQSDEFGYSSFNIGADWLSAVDPEKSYSSKRSTGFKKYVEDLTTSDDPEQRVKAFDMLKRNYPVLDIFKIEYLIDSLRLNRIPKDDHALRAGIMVYYVINGGHRCMPGEGLIRVTDIFTEDSTTPGRMIDEGKLLGNQGMSGDSSHTNYVKVKLGELLLESGLEMLAERDSDSESQNHYRANTAVALTRYRTHLFQWEGQAALDRALESWAVANRYDPESRSVALAGYELALATRSWESAAKLRVTATERDSRRIDAGTEQLLRSEMELLDSKQLATQGEMNTRYRDFEVLHEQSIVFPNETAPELSDEFRRAVDAKESNTNL